MIHFVFLCVSLPALTNDGFLHGTMSSAAFHQLTNGQHGEENIQSSTYLHTALITLQYLQYHSSLNLMF